MAASRLIILGVAVAAAGGAGYVAKNMTAAPPAQIVVDQGPSQPAIALTEVLVASGDVPMGAGVGEQLSWQEWPSDGISDKFITRQAEPNALDELKTAIARVPIYAGEPLRRSKLVGESLASSRADVQHIEGDQLVPHPAVMARLAQQAYAQDENFRGTRPTLRS